MMQMSSPNRTVFIVDGNRDFSDSAKILLETRDCLVQTVAYAEDFDVDHVSCEPDVILLDLHHKNPHSFKLLNELIYSDTKLGIVLTTEPDSAIHSTDIFPGKRVRILVHPIAPGDLITAIETLNN